MRTISSQETKMDERKFMIWIDKNDMEAIVFNFATMKEAEAFADRNGIDHKMICKRVRY